MSSNSLHHLDEELSLLLGNIGVRTKDEKIILLNIFGVPSKISYFNRWMFLIIFIQIIHTIEENELYDITSGTGVFITGEVGTGKTTLSQQSKIN